MGVTTRNNTKYSHLPYYDCVDLAATWDVFPIDSELVAEIRRRSSMGNLLEMHMNDKDNSAFSAVKSPGNDHAYPPPPPTNPVGVDHLLDLVT
jgi:hypothetical protein